MINNEIQEEYKSLSRSLNRKNQGFGLFFVECCSEKKQEIIDYLKHNVDKTIKVLEFTKPIDSLYRVICENPSLTKTEILVISGLEFSLFEYENYKFKNDVQQSQVTHAQNWQGVPRFLGYLNLQRDTFRDEFPIIFVFILPEFVINYFINRAPDFFDFRSGLFTF